MSQKETAAVIVIFAGVFAGLFYHFTKADLKTLVRNLDQFRPPKKWRENRAHKDEPLITIIGQGERAVGPLVATLSDPARPPRAKIGAAIALGWLKADAAADPLAALLGVEQDELYRFAAIALLKVGQEGKEGIARLLKGDAPRAARIHAMHALALFGQDARALMLIGQTLRGDKDPAVREAAVHALATVSGPGAAQWQAVARQDAHEQVRYAAEQGLSRRTDGELVSAARALVKEHDKPASRKLGMLLVRKLHNRDAYIVLRTGFADPELSVACAAAPGYARWFKEYPQTRSTFLDRLKALLGRATEREHLLDLGRAAAEGKATELVDFFLGWLDKGRTEQRLAACAALAKTADKTKNGVVIRYLEDPDAAVARAVHTCAVRLLARAKKDQPALHFWVRDPEPPAKRAWWDAWWNKQQKIYALSDEADELKRVAMEKIKTLKQTELKKAKRMLEEAREKLIALGKMCGKEPTRRITNVQQEIITLMKHGTWK